MREMKKIADTIIEHIETEYDCPSRHEELGFKVPVLDLAVWVEEVEVASPGLDDQKLHSCCSGDEICLPLGEPSAHMQPSNHQSYTTPVHRGCNPGRSNLNCLSDAELILSSGSQLQFLQPSVVYAPHPTTRCLAPGGLCPPRSGSSASVHAPLMA